MPLVYLMFHAAGKPKALSSVLIPSITPLLSRFGVGCCSSASWMITEPCIAFGMRYTAARQNNQQREAHEITFTETVIRTCGNCYYRQTVNAEDYNVGLHTGGDNAPSSSANDWTPSTDGNVTKNAKFGTLTIKEEAQVVLGGQYKTETGYLNMGSIAEHTGVIADKVVVEGDFEAGADGKVDKLNLNTWNLSVNTLEVNSGTVAVHNKVQSGKINYSDGKITATIPEPTTTTLSLLALAALVVRRRR